MGEEERVLSQEEIDALLKATPKKGGTAEEKEKKIAKYDFKQYLGMATEGIQSFKPIHDKFRFLLEKWLCVQVHTGVKVEVVAPQSCTLGEFVTSTANPSYIQIFSFEGIIGDMYCVMEPSFVHSIVDIVLGGSGRLLKSPEEITLIEANIIQNYGPQILGFLREAWNEIMNIPAVKIEATMTNPLTAASAESPEPVLFADFVFTMDVKDEVTSERKLRIAYSQSAEHTLTAGTVTYRVSRFHPMAGRFRGRTEKILQSVELPVFVQLGKTILSIREIVELEAGDVVKFNTKVSDELVCYVGDKKKWLGKPGVCGKMLLYKIKRLYFTEEKKEEKKRLDSA